MTTEPSASIILVGRGTDDDGWERDAWSVELTYQGRTMHTTFYTGIMHPTPIARDVLESLFFDAQGVEYDGFEAWADNYGFDTDSRKAFASYEGVIAQTEKLKELCGADFDAIQDRVFAEANA